MRSILVQTGRDPQNAARLDSAIAIARANQGHVTLLIDTPIEQYMTVDPYGGTYLAREALESAIAADDALAALCEQRLAAGDVAFDVAKFEAAPIEAFCAAAQLADLVVVSRGSGLAGNLAFESSAPVLVLSSTGSLPHPLTTACIAWDGSSPAARALRCAVPLLRTCPNVHVLTVAKSGGDGFPPSDALRYLARHGIKAELIELPKAHSVERTLAAQIALLNAQLLVMGAYSHNRVREFMFGGVTRYFLEDAKVPALLMAH